MQGTAYQIDKGPILEIPIYKPKEALQLLSSYIVDCILFKKKYGLELEVETFESVIDALLFNFYFPDYMKDRNIDILQFVEKDVKEVMQNREFDQLTETQKEKAINQLHARWTDPESEIVKRMNSFAGKSPDILKPILENT